MCIATVCGLTRAVKKDIEVTSEALKYAVKPRIHTGIGTSESHIKYKFNSNPEAILERAHNAVSFAKRFVEDVEFYAEDAGKPIRKSHENPYIIKLYEEFLGKPMSEKAHHLLHTGYFDKSKKIEIS